MSIVGNYSVLNKSPGRWRSGTTQSADRSNFNSFGGARNRFVGEASVANVTDRSAIPNGYLAPASWSLPQKDGGLATYKSLSGSISTTANLVSGKGLEASISGAISITNAQLDQIVSLIASITGSISTTDAELAAVAGIQASITATGTITDAQLGALLGMSANLSALGTLSDAGIFATAALSADIGGAEALSPQGLAEALLDNNDIEAGYSLREILRLLSAAMAGKLSGAPGTTITIKNVNDDKNRIVATVDANGNRTSVVYDVSD